MNKRGILVMLGIACLLSIYGVYAEDLNLKITGTINNLTSDVYLKTSSDASISIDGYDFGVRNLPATYSQFYTTSSGEDLFIDAWNWSSSRTVNLTFSSDSSQTGTLTFSWVLLAGNYSGNFIYYGDDSSYTDVVSTTDMRAADSASADVSSGTTFYAQVSLTDYVAPLTCGDGTCNNGETCSTCAADCGSCPATSSGGGGGGSATTTLRKPLNLAIDLREVVIDVLTGSSKQRIITIRNPTNSEQKVDISKLGLKNIVTFDVTSFTLAPGESRDIIVNFNSGDNPGIDVGKIYIGGNEVLVSINSKSKQLLFDASISVPSSNKVMSVGGKLSSQINLM
ncbi:MAG: hypothetical protein KKB21_05490, partial [Nanoarchaeota archaeon]|nr:hypothetical protein [Nanoarchaeota archaeon]